MKTIGLTIAATIAAATLTATTTHAATTTQQIQSLRSGIQWQRARAWHWQQVAGIRRSPTIRGAALPHSVGYLKWIEHRWSKRRVYAYRIAHRPAYRTLSSSRGIAHEALWLCIHRGEAGWHQPSYAVDSHGNPLYWGGLQMTIGWDGLVDNAALLSPRAQMQAAETGYRQSGYSVAWLEGQWPNSSPSCLGYR